jgi:hypothetical protein
MENREMARTHRLSMTGALIVCLVGSAVLSAGIAGLLVGAFTWR